MEILARRGYTRPAGIDEKNTSTVRSFVIEWKR
jgi:hypothetical protein